MTSNDFLDVLGKVDDAFVEEAAVAGAYLPSERQVTNHRHTKRIWLVAAAFALVVLSCASWLMLRKGPDPGAAPSDDPRLAGTSSAPVATAPNATEFVWPEDEFPYPRAATLQWLEDMGISLEAYYEMLKHPAYMAMSGDGTREIDADPELEAALMRLRIGGLYLGQPQEEVYALYGEPRTKGISDEVQSDGTKWDLWGYHFGEEQSLWVDFVDAGNGFVVNDVSTSANLEAGMPCGIQIGQPFDEAEAAFRENPVINEAAVRRDFTDPVSGSQYGHISVMLTDVKTGEPGCLEFAVRYRDQNEDGKHIVKSIHLGSLYPDPPAVYVNDPEREQAMLALRIGGLYLGMPEAELLALCGEPDAKSNVGPVTYDDGNARITWAYYRTEDTGLSLELIDAGDGYVVNEIRTTAALEGGLPFGMEFGQSLAEAEAALAQCPVLYDARQNSYDEKTDEGLIVIYAAPGNPGYYDRLSLVIVYRHDVIWSIKLGPLYADCELPDENLKDQEEINRRFDSGEISVWLPEGSGWQGSDYREEEAKLLSAQFSVSLPEPWEYDGSAPVAVLDFHNGYAAALFDEQEHGAVYRVTDRDAFEKGLAQGDPLRGLELWEYGRFAPNTMLYVSDPELVSADWDFNYNVDAPMDKLLSALEKKDAILFRASDDRTVLFREKKHYVLAYAYGENERITGYARFFEDHSMDIVAGYKVPLIELDEPARLLGMKLDAVKAAWGEPCFETVVNGRSCPGYLTLSGYVVVLHPGNDSTVTEIELYDHDPTPVTIR